MKTDTLLLFLSIPLVFSWSFMMTIPQIHEAEEG